MARNSRLSALVRAERANAALSWLLVAVVAASVAASVPNDPVWVVFALVTAAVAVLPPVAFGEARAMLPWEVLALAALPTVGRALATPGLTSDLATYVGIAALALVVAVELDVFTRVRLANWFSVVFVVVATMATAGFLAVLGWISDLTVGTAFVLPAEPPLTAAQEHAAVTALVQDFVAATVAGVLAAVVFVWYFRRRADASLRLPAELEVVVE
ncbi:hypothetical protein [Halobacterium noricense]|uniref:hypothetical protein n=1 Tax=Halobacterium noricense TaxID=223182 RepID=UPI001E2F2A92|nr:hypothetical protein [Halobacterium noricense]UHH24434.1 hypothetical protein LT974_10580 [Halobacterium noricense]